MTPIYVRSSIDVEDDGGDVEVAVVVGFANLFSGKINIKPVGGSLSTLVPEVEAGAHYSLGSAADLVTTHVRMVLTGQVGDPNGAVQGSFYVVCTVFQNGQSIGSSDAVTGKYGPGDALQVLNIICSFT
jgi:hypothetical protein